MTDPAPSDVRSINCTHCGAGLPVLGGGRVITQVCGYCGAALDASDAYRVLEVFDGQARPDTPFRMGMQGKIDGVTFTIIGTMGMTEEWRGRRWDWVDHQLFSPTHGYAWLTVEDGHCVLTRKRRDGPMAGFVTSARVEQSDNRPSLRWHGRRYRYYETNIWRTSYLEGEFNWRPERDATGTTVALMTDDPDDGMLLCVEPNGTGEREIELSRYWPDAFATFGVQNPPKPRGRHPLQPLPKQDALWPAVGWFAGLAVVALLLSFVVMAMQPGAVQLYSGQSADLPEALTFTVTDIDRPARLRLYQGLRNNFAGYEVMITEPDGTLIADTFREISFYSGLSGDDAWTEGSRSQTLNFLPEQLGDYTLAVTPETPSDIGPDLVITFEEGRRNPGWLWAVMGLFGACAVAVIVLGNSAKFARWKGSDWTTED